MKRLLKVILLVVAFIAASAATYVAIQKWNAVEPVMSGKQHQDTLEGVSGLTEGETVTLPQLSTLNGQTVNLGNLREERLLCVFISTRCPGCAMDADLWRDLNEESGKRGVAFYLIDVGDELDDLEKFRSAHGLHNLPILLDPNHKVGPQLKVGFLPQYILFTRNGRVLHRWDGIRHYDQPTGAEKLAEFFQYRP